MILTLFRDRLEGSYVAMSIDEDCLADATSKLVVSLKKLLSSWLIGAYKLRYRLNI